MSWRFVPGVDEGLLRRAADALLHPDSLAPEATLKRGGRRHVFVLEGDPPAVVKANRMRGLKDGLLHFRRWSEREARHLIEAAARGLPVPAVRAVGRGRRHLVVRWTALVMEDLRPRPTLETALGSTRDDPSRQAALLERAGALLRRIQAAGLLHADPSGQSFLVGHDATDDRIIDLQYCGRPRAPGCETLAFQAAYLADSLGGRVPEDLLEPWARDLLVEAAGQEPDAAARTFAAWRGRRLSRKERLRLGRS